MECLGATRHLLGANNTVIVFDLGFDPLELCVDGCEVRAPNNGLQQFVWYQVVQRCSLEIRMGDDPGISNLAANTLLFWQPVAELRNAGTASRVVELARLYLHNLLTVAMPPSCDLSPELQPTVVARLTRQR